jgi:NAD-dependent DNA ligase
MTDLPLLPVSDLTADQARVELERLSAAIASADIAYHQNDAPNLSDADYDKLRQTFDDLAAAFPELLIHLKGSHRDMNSQYISSDLVRAGWISRIADDWLHVLDGAFKSDLVAILQRLPSKALQRIYLAAHSFPNGISEEDRTKRLREVLSFSVYGKSTVIDELIGVLRSADIAYYQQDAPFLTDAQYDKLRNSLDYYIRAAADKVYPPYLRKINKVGAPPSKNFHKIRHGVPMLSLGNIFTKADLEDFFYRARKAFPREYEAGEIEFVAEKMGF